MKEDWEHIERRAAAIAALRALPKDDMPSHSSHILDSMGQYGSMDIQAHRSNHKGLLPTIAYEIFAPLIAEGMKKYREKLTVIANGLADE